MRRASRLGEQDKGGNEMRREQQADPPAPEPHICKSDKPLAFLHAPAPRGLCPAARPPGRLLSGPMTVIKGVCQGYGEWGSLNSADHIVLFRRPLVRDALFDPLDALHGA